MNSAQLTFGLMSGVEQAAPFAEGDILVTKAFGRVVVHSVDDNVNGLVFVSTRLDNGNSVLVLEREVLYRSR